MTQDTHPTRPFFIAGPTASGKSAVALALARRIGGEIVNADAFQLYRGLDILTAKPRADDLAQAPHHLYSVLAPGETCDAQRYRNLALPVIQDIAARGGVPIVTGGSGLYLKALTHGLAPLPSADPDLRAELDALPLEEQVRQLLVLDPKAAETVNLTNPRYVQRALEICLLTGRPQSELRRNWLDDSPQVQGVCLVWERDPLYRRIDQRVRDMIAAGAVQEVAEAEAALSSTAGKAIGVREIQRHLASELSLEEAVAAIQQATRRYAKRQMTWFRRERCFQTICLTPETTPDSAAQDILERFPCLLQPPTPPAPSAL